MQRQFISYPKSGRSWIRYILAQLGCEPLIQFHHDGFEFNDGAKPALDFSVAARLGRYADEDRLVYLRRDPRDVMVSLFHQVTGRFHDFFGYTGSISEFIRDPYFGADNLRRFRDMWQEIAARRSLLVVAYEDCHADMPGQMHRILRHYGFDVAAPALAEAVANAEFERMRRLEQSGLYPEPWLRLRNGSAKVRAGKVGGFRSVLGPEDIVYLNRVFGLSS